MIQFRHPADAAHWYCLQFISLEPQAFSFAMSTLLRFHLLLALSRFHTAFIKGMPFGACHGRMPQPVLTCAPVVIQLVTSVEGEFDGGT